MTSGTHAGDKLWLALLVAVLMTICLSAATLVVDCLLVGTAGWVIGLTAATFVSMVVAFIMSVVRLGLATWRSMTQNALMKLVPFFCLADAVVWLVALVAVLLRALFCGD